MKNQYDLSEDGQTVTIWLNRKGKRYACLIDADDLPKVNAMPNTWFVLMSNKDPKDLCVYSNEQADGKRTAVYLHRLIMDAPSEMYVDHRNHNGLDNRRQNLVVTTMSGVHRHRCNLTTKNNTGHYGVSLYPGNGKYYLQLRFGYFDTIEEALAARNQFPEYANQA
jgi:hypothetical protein